MKNTSHKNLSLGLQNQAFGNSVFVLQKFTTFRMFFSSESELKHTFNISIKFILLWIFIYVYLQK